MKDQFLTVKEAAELLRVSKSQVYLLISQKRFPYIRLSPRRIVIRESDLEAWVDAKKEEGIGDGWYLPTIK